MTGLAAYPIALLRLMGSQLGSASKPPLGMTKRDGVQKMQCSLPAHRVLLALIEYAPSPDTIAEEFLDKLDQCAVPGVTDSVYQIKAKDMEGGSVPGAWATMAHEQLQKSGGDVVHLRDMASHYLSHLIFAFRKGRGGVKPAPVTDPGVRCTEDIEKLMNTAITRKSLAVLKNLIFLRDGRRCPITNLRFGPLPPRCTRIIPRSIHSKPQTHLAIEKFTGHVLDADFIQRHIYHPCNALNIELNTSDVMYKRCWGLEARFSDSQCKYYYRAAEEGFVSPFTTLEDGDEVVFGGGISGDKVPLPDPNICNLHLAIARASYACGASKIFDQKLNDIDVEKLLQLFS